MYVIYEGKIICLLILNIQIYVCIILKYWKEVRDEVLRAITRAPDDSTDIVNQLT